MEGNVVDPGFPATYATSVNVQQALPSIRFDPTYFNIRNINGMIRIAQMVFNLIGYICISANSYSGAFATWFSFVSLTAFLVTGFLIVFYVMHVVERLQKVPWMKLELGYCGLWTFFYLTASSACASWGGKDGFIAASAFFGFVAMILYGVDTFFKFKGWRRGDLAQGERQINQAENPEVLSPGAY